MKSSNPLSERASIFCDGLLRRKASSAKTAALLSLLLTAAMAFALALLSGWAWAGQRVTSRTTRAVPDLEEQVLPKTRRAELPAKKSEETLSQLRVGLRGVKTPDAAELEKVLNAQFGGKGGSDESPLVDRLDPVGDLDGDGIHEVVFEWFIRSVRTPRRTAAVDVPPVWTLFLLAWDGSQWGAEQLTSGTGTYRLEVLPRLASSPALAVIENLASAPYPVIFEFREHLPALLWDARAEESRYQGYRNGEVEFLKEEGYAAPLMVVTGKADPGVLVIRRESPRGFQATAVYAWDGKGYVPLKAEYEANEDYTLYRFIAALHLRDFRSAYALIDAPRFLKTDQPSPELFRKQVEENYPEFLGNNIFEAQDVPAGSANDYAFELRRRDEVFIYRPTFSGDARYLLTSLERREEKP